MIRLRSTYNEMGKLLKKNVTRTPRDLSEYCLASQFR